MPPILKLMRPRQWTKNVLVFAGVIFSQHYDRPGDWFTSLQVFAFFSLVASGIYVLNDLFDVEKDRIHPEKKYRPIASGDVSRGTAWVLGPLLIAAGIAWSTAFNAWVVAIMASYAALMVLYSVWLKHVLLVDVFVIAAGFTARAMIGAAAIEVVISKWLIVCAFFIGLLLALIKRRQELARIGENRTEGRRSLHKAPPVHVWDLWVMMISAVTILAYTLYTFDTATIERVGSHRLMYTTPIVVFALLRYQLGMFMKGTGEDPTEAVLRDPWILLALLGWLALVLLVLTGVM